MSSPPCPPTQEPSHQVGGWQVHFYWPAENAYPVETARAQFFQPKDDDFHLLISPHERTPATVMSTADSEQRIASTKIVMPSSSSFFDKHFCEFKATLKNFETCVSSWTWVTCQTLAHSYIVQINRNRCGWCKWKSVRGKKSHKAPLKHFADGFTYIKKLLLAGKWLIRLLNAYNTNLKTKKPYWRVENAFITTHMTLRS